MTTCCHEPIQLSTHCLHTTQHNPYNTKHIGVQAMMCLSHPIQQLKLATTQCNATGSLPQSCNCKVRMTTCWVTWICHILCGKAWQSKREIMMIVFYVGISNISMVRVCSSISGQWKNNQPPPGPKEKVAHKFKSWLPNMQNTCEYLHDDKALLLFVTLPLGGCASQPPSQPGHKSPTPGSPILPKHQAIDGCGVT